MAAEPLPEQPSVLARIWADLEASGWHEAVLRYATHGLMLALTLIVIALGRVNLDAFRLPPQLRLQPPAGPAPIASQPAITSPIPAEPAVAVFQPARLPAAASGAISRRTELHTLIPTRGRNSVITYTVVTGDTLFGIAERFALRPETVLWGNYLTLKDDPHSLRPGQVLTILPVDGTYHYITAGNTLDKIAAFYRVTVEAIVDWPGNELDSANPALKPDTYLVIPGGRRELQVWTVPGNLTRASTLKGANNFGQCPGGYTGALGTGALGWPTDARYLSGFNFSAVHRGIDLRAPLGAPIYAVDAGVVVYAGWNDWGYGNLVVIDHGNGWQSVYAHLSQWNVVCGQSVRAGEVIGLSGNTGRSSGAHLHFELRFNGSYVNPLDVLP